MKTHVSLVGLLTSILAPSMAPCQVATSHHWVRLLTTEGETVDLDTAAVGRGDDSFIVWLRWDLDRQDRKSTRLNSSHSQISYAVFCLKKKNYGAVPGSSMTAYTISRSVRLPMCAPRNLLSC